MGKSKFQISRSLDEKIRRIISGSNESESEFSLVSSAYILGFNYGNVTNCVALTTNYQLHHAVFPVVGLVFFKEAPTDEEIRSHLKSVKEYSSSPNGLGSFKADRNEHLFLIYSVDSQSKEVDKRIFNFSKGTFVRRKRHRLIILNDPYCPRNVYNGSEDVFNLGDGDSMSSAEGEQVDHLIFFIHGVGGVCDVRFRSCVEVVADFKKMANLLLAQHSDPSSGVSTPTANRHLASSLKKGFFRKHSNESSTSRASDASDETTPSTPTPKSKTKRVECLPISWHSLTRRQTGFSEQMNIVALSSVPKLRHFLNKVVMDAMLYATGPVYAQTIMNNVGNEINRLYTLFMERHPNFTGSISLAGHSLGSVIVFDLLAHQIPDNLTPTEQSNSNNNNNNTNDTDNGTKSSTLKLPMNSRQTCYNISHNHHDLQSTDTRYCSDYKNLQELLKDMDLAQFAEVFHREHIDLNSLLLLTDFDMKELRLPLGARRKLGTYINLKRISTSCVNDNMQDTASRGDLFGNMNTGQYLMNYPQLKFKPRCFFSFGSPTAMFLNLRGIQQIGENYKLPTCDRMFNIYHPYDPLAYRFEPLIDPRFKGVEAILIPHHRGGKRIHVQLREGFAKVGQDIKHRLLGTFRNTWATFAGLGTANDTPDMSRSSSIVDPADVQLVAKSKRQKLVKSASADKSSTERESFETCTSHLSDSATQPGESGRNPLKRQHQLRKSLSEAPNSLSDSTGRSSLSSIIEGSMRPATVEDESEPEAGVLNKLKMFKMDPDSKIEISCSNDLAESNDEKTDRRGASSSKRSEKQSSVSEDAEESDQTRIGRLNGGRRVDYVLQEKPIELFNEYIFAFTSHANYWLNEDAALMILNEIYQVDGINLSDQLD